MTVWNAEIDRILQRGMYLEEVMGVRNWGLRPVDAIGVLGELQKAGIGVLGGDLYVEVKGRLRPAYSVWHCDPKPGEAESEFVSRSVEASKIFLEKYLSRNDIMVALVPRR